MIRKVIAFLFLCACPLVAQTTIQISDSNGHQTYGVVQEGQLFFHDSSGNIAVGNIQGGNVFLSTSQGEITFGTVKNGNVFLNDNGGVTTGTIRNGTIFFQSSDGSITTGTYNVSAGRLTATTFTSSPTSPNQTDDGSSALQQKIAEQQQEMYQTGYAAGYALGAAMVRGSEHHKMLKFCKANPTAIYFDAGSEFYNGTFCKDAPFNQAQRQKIDDFCRYNPGSETGFGLHRVTCFDPPPAPNLKWAKWEMDGFHRDYKAQEVNKTDGVDQSRMGWSKWRYEYCLLAPTGTVYKDLNGKKQRCN